MKPAPASGCGNLIGHIDEGLPLLPSFTTLESPAGTSDALLPALAAWAALLNDIPIIAGTHVARVRLADSRGHEQGRDIDEHKFQEGVVIGELVVQDALQDLRILLRLLPARDLVERVGAEAEITRLYLEVLDEGLAAGGLVLNHPAVGAAGAADLVELLLAAHDQGFPGAGDLEGLGEGGSEVPPGDADDTGLEQVLDGVGEGPDVVEDGPPGELPADGGDVPHAGVEEGREEEGVVGLRVHPLDVCRRHGAQDRGAGLHLVDQVSAARL